MIAFPAFPRDVIVDICILHRVPQVRAMSPVNAGEWDDNDEEQDDEDIELPFPDDDPDWGFDDEEAQPEQGDFWMDSDDEEDAL